MSREEFSFKVGDITICFVQMYHDCWICSLPELTAKKLRIETVPHKEVHVDHLEISERAKNALLSNNMSTIRDIVKVGNLLKKPGIGRKVRNEIITLFKAHNIPTDTL